MKYNPFAPLPDRVETIARSNTQRGVVLHLVNNRGMVQKLSFATVQQLAEIGLIDANDKEFLELLHTYDPDTCYVLLFGTPVRSNSAQIETSWCLFRYRLTLTA